MPDKEFFDILNKLETQHLEAEFSPIKELYVDLATMKDLRFGLVYSLANEEERKYLIENLPKYNLRPNRSFTFGFDKLADREELYKQQYTSKQYQEQMFDFAPDTDFSDVLLSFIVSFATRNIQAGYRENMVLTINTYPIEDCQNLAIFKRIFTRFIGSRLTVKFICTEPKKISKEFWQRKQFLVLDDVGILSDTKCGLYEALIKNQVMITAKIFAPYACEQQAIDRWEKLDKEYYKKLRDFFTPTEFVLQSLCEFKFVPCLIPI